MNANSRSVNFWRWPRPVICATVVMVLLVFCLSADSRDDKPYDVFLRQRNLHGVALPEMQVDLSAPINGVVWEVLVAEGDRIRESDILLVMDNRAAMEDYRSAEISARGDAMMRHAASELKLSHSNLVRLTRAVQQGAANEYELEELRIRYEQALAQYDAEKEKRDQALQTLAAERVNLELHNLRAPFDGRVIRLETKKGASATSSAPILSVASLKKLKVELHMPLDRFGELKPGEVYSLQGGSPVNACLTGTLVSIDPIVDSATESFRCVFSIDNADEKLPAGFAVELLPASP